MAKVRAPKRRSLRRDGADAFIPEPPSGAFIAVPDADAGSAAEEFIASATSADYVLEDARNEIAVDELGGPFLEEETVLVVSDSPKG
jgi:hypothetical protein